MYESLQSKVSVADRPAPFQVPASAKVMSALSLVADSLLGSADVWTPRRKWPTRAWNRVRLDHCPVVNFAAVEPDGAKAALIMVQKVNFSASLAELPEVRGF